jgi:tight adherence protein C
MIIIAICAGMMVLFLSLAYFTTRGRAPVEERLARLSGDPDEPQVVQAKESKDKEKKTFLDADEDVRAKLGRLVARFAGSRAREGSSKNQAYDTVRQRLIEAGFRGRSALGVYMGSRVVLGGGLSFLVVLVSWTLGTTPPIVGIGVGAAAGYILPGIVIDRLGKRRQTAIQRGLADAIDLMVVCVEAGLGLGATMLRVSQEFEDTEPIIAHELRMTVAETQAGRGLMTALRGMARRTGNQDLNSLVALLIQTERLGTPVAQTLRSQAEAMRVTRMQKAEEVAQKAPIKMMFPAGLIFLAILLILAGPAAIMLTGALGDSFNR